MVIYLLIQVQVRSHRCLMLEKSPVARAAGHGSALGLVPQSTCTRAWGPSTRC
jgi:hypothetical protein